MVETIKELCKEQKISLHALELKTGIHRGNIARWDEHVPSIDKVVTVADFFGVSLDFLVGRSNEDNYLFRLFNKLNDEGQEKVLAYINDLCNAGTYDKKNNQLEMVEGA